MTTASEWRFEAIGTVWTITTAVPLADEIRAAVTARIDAYDAVWSRFRPDSVVRGLARTGGEAVLGPEADELFGLYTDLADLTKGAVNPLIGRALEELGYDAQYSFRVRGLEPTVPRWSQLAWEPPVLRLDRPMLLDVGAAGKGQLVDLVSAVLADRGIEAATVDAGGDLVHRGPGPLRIGLEHPEDPDRVLGVVTLNPGQAICASAANRRVWGDGLHHVIDGRDGRPTAEAIATWCVAPRAMLADGAATALFFCEPSRVAARFDVGCVRIDAEGRIVHSGDLDVEWLL